MVGNHDSIWLGGKQESSVKSWSDNSTWGYTNWLEGQGSSRSDFYIWMLGFNGDWYAESSPSDKKTFICQLATPTFAFAKEKVHLSYKKDQLSGYLPNFAILFLFSKSSF